MSAKSRYGRGARGIDQHAGSSRYVGKHVNPDFWLSPAMKTKHHPFLTRREMEGGAIDVAWGPRGGPVMPINKSKPGEFWSPAPEPSAILHPDPTEKKE